MAWPTDCKCWLLVRICRFLVFHRSLCSGEWTHFLLGGRNRNIVGKKNDRLIWSSKTECGGLELILQSIIPAWIWLNRGNFLLCSSYSSVQAAQLCSCHSFPLAFLVEIGPPLLSVRWEWGCKCLASIRPPNQIHIFLVEQELWGIVKGRGSRGLHSKQQCVCGMISCLAPR